MDVTSNFEVESELDELILRIFELMNQHIVCKVNIENYIKSGCIDLAKARYINGNRSISALQLPTEGASGIQAKFTVLPTETEGKLNYQTYKYTGNSDLDEQNISKCLKNMHLNPSEDKSSKFSSDPLKWFGFLVPQSLRQSKSTFEKCLEIIVESTNIQLELQNSIQRYEELRNSLKQC